MTDLAQKIQRAIVELEKRTIEREELIRLAILALFSQKHMFLIGERGVGKSYIIRLLSNLIDGAKYWELQVGIDTEAKQLFGEKRIAENGTVYYEATNTILDAHIAFLDEMFKAKSEVLNSLLQIMADRYYTTGDGRMIEVPLISLFGASNEYPTGSIAEPYLDRLTFWYEVKRIQSEENRLRYFAMDFDKSPIQEPIFTLEEVLKVRKEALKVAMNSEILQLYNVIVNNLVAQKVKTSDRKFLNIIEVIKTSAYLNGREEVDFSDLFLLLNTAWHNDIERRKVKETVFDALFSNKIYINSLLEEISKLLIELDSFKNGELFDFFNYRIELHQSNAQKIYDNYLEKVKTLLERYLLIEKRIAQIKAVKQRVDYIEELVQKNIFIPNYKNETFYPENLDRLYELDSNVTVRIAEVKRWLEKNGTLLDYKRNTAEIFTSTQPF